jgi:hypothetical protein
MISDFGQLIIKQLHLQVTASLFSVSSIQGIIHNTFFVFRNTVFLPLFGFVKLFGALRLFARLVHFRLEDVLKVSGG